MAATALGFLLLLLLLESGSAALVLSKSDLQVCINNGNPQELKCNKKILMTLAVPSGQTDEDMITITEVRDPQARNGKQVLAKPITVKIAKSPGSYVYPLSYVQNLNADPYEHVVSKSKKCRAGLDEGASCGVVKDSRGNLVPGSSGFCCNCERLSKKWKWFRGLNRPSGCGKWNEPGYAFCLRYGSMWYRVYRVGLGTMSFRLQIKLTSEEGTTVLLLTPSVLSGMNVEKTLTAALAGDLASYTQVPVLDGRMLNIPDSTARTGRWPEFTSGNPAADPNLWLLLDSSRYALSGMICDKIGISYLGYQRQPEGCRASMGVCLREQIVDFMKEDKNARAHGQRPLHAITRYGKPTFNTIGPTTLEIEVPPTNSIVTLEFSANKVTFVRNKSPGKVISATVKNFEAMSTAGQLTTRVVNTGTVFASYGLYITCSGGIVPIAGQTIGLAPNAPRDDVYQISTTNTKAAKYSCDVVLKDSEGEKVDQKTAIFATTVTMFNNGTQANGVVVGGRKNETFGKGFGLKGIGGFFKKSFGFLTKPLKGIMDRFNNILGQCKACPGKLDIPCFIYKLCLKKLAAVVAVIVAIGLFIYGITLLQSMGVLSPMCSCCCLPLRVLTNGPPGGARAGYAADENADEEEVDKKPDPQESLSVLFAAQAAAQAAALDRAEEPRRRRKKHKYSSSSSSSSISSLSSSTSSD